MACRKSANSATTSKAHLKCFVTGVAKASTVLLNQSYLSCPIYTYSQFPQDSILFLCCL